MKYVKAVNLLKKPWQDGKLSEKIRLRRLNQIIQKKKRKRTRRTNI